MNAGLADEFLTDLGCRFRGALISFNLQASLALRRSACTIFGSSKRWTLV
jgi:hypothetical protein